jgi:hypothetical protein
MAMVEDQKEDLKYSAVIVGGNLLISLATILAGSLIALNDSPVIAFIGNVVNGLGWFWVAGTVGVAMVIRARMHQLYGTSVKVPVRAGK